MVGLVGMYLALGVVLCSVRRAQAPRVSNRSNEPTTCTSADVAVAAQVGARGLG